MIKDLAKGRSESSERRTVFGGDLPPLTESERKGKYLTPSFFFSVGCKLNPAPPRCFAFKCAQGIEKRVVSFFLGSKCAEVFETKRLSRKRAFGRITQLGLVSFFQASSGARTRSDVPERSFAALRISHPSRMLNFQRATQSGPAALAATSRYILSRMEWLVNRVYYTER